MNSAVSLPCLSNEEVVAPAAGSASPQATESERPATRASRTARHCKLAVGLVPFGLHGLALMAAAGPAVLAPTGLPRVLALGLAAPLYTLALVTSAGLVGRAARRWIVAGRFPRDAATALYRGRLIYGAAWTSVYYCRPVYHAVLGFSPLKALAFRLFGYRGSLDFATYPDAWIRDLPLLELGKGVYLSNRCTIGTNMVMADGRILVDSVRLGERVLIGHLAMIAPGCELGDGTEVGVGCAVGMKVKAGRNVHIAPTCSINHGARLGDGVVIDSMCLIGRRASIAAGLRIPPGTIVPDRARLESQADVDRLVASRASARSKIDGGG